MGSLPSPIYPKQTVFFHYSPDISYVSPGFEWADVFLGRLRAWAAWVISPHGMVGWKNLDTPPINSRMVGGNTKVLRHSCHFIGFHHENPKVGSPPQYQSIPQEIKPS